MSNGKINAGDARLVGMVNAETHASKTSVDSDWVETWPHLIFIELIALLLVTAGLWLFSFYVDAPLEEMANAAYTPKIAKAPWYFVGLQELLVYFDPWIAGVILPGIIIIGLAAIPYLDRSKDNVGIYSARRRPLAYAIFIFGLVLWFLLILIGTYFRGPNWAWYWPWESWELAKAPLPDAYTLPWPVGVGVLVAYVGAGIWLPARTWPRFKRQLGTTRYVLVMLLLLGMLAVPLKVILRLVLGVRYILETAWFNI